MGTGRLLDTGAGPAAWNMAVDDALAEGVRLGLSPPTLRVYRWVQPSLSLGRAQRLAPAPGGIDLAPAYAHGLDVVRRPTGGRAVLHAGDFTYAIAVGGLPTGVRASYAVLAEGLSRALARLGVTRTAMGREAPGGRSPACFASATPADLRADDAKLLGSAQARRGPVVLQHGSLYLRYPAGLARAVFPAGAGEVTDLATLLGDVPAWDELARAFAAGLGEVLGLDWERGELAPWELAQVQAGLARFSIDAEATL